MPLDLMPYIYIRLMGAPAVMSTDRRTWDQKAQEHLWTESERITGAKFQGL
jgi:hypothetical protein